ncbi:hypothetical protein [Sporolactobacillus putidus]|uniref:Transcriptional regulator n=1 Tax=Sporolactobacillus putidus TaxID=492735 RepID=A0A917W353_9BACL|nr:hypothetical protein [Sporolactobacillus putidus]GGL58069.1 hypothetical protein GCM10007968_22600 [Sporolactobacillus putidus]
MSKPASTKAAKVEKARFLHAEQEWRDYKTNIETLNNLNNGTVEMTDLFPNSTFSAAGKRLEYMEKVLNAIERVYDESPAELKEFARLLYWNDNPLKWYEVAAQMGINRYKALQWRKAIILKTQHELGWR